MVGGIRCGEGGWEKGRDVREGHAQAQTKTDHCGTDAQTARSLPEAQDLQQLSQSRSRTSDAPSRSQQNISRCTKSSSVQGKPNSQSNSSPQTPLPLSSLPALSASPPCSRQRPRAPKSCCWGDRTPRSSPCTHLTAPANTSCISSAYAMTR